MTSAIDMHRAVNAPDSDRAFIEAVEAMAAIVHRNAADKGFWGPDRVDGVVIALIHSEASELLEAIRNGNPPSEHIPEFTAAEEELADIVIRCLDFGVGRGHRVAAAVIAKHRFNTTRPMKHGGKAF